MNAPPFTIDQLVRVLASAIFVGMLAWGLYTSSRGMTMSSGQAETVEYQLEGRDRWAR